MHRYGITKNTIKNKIEGFKQIGEEVYIETENNSDAFEMFTALCDFYGIDAQYIEVVTRDGKDILEAKAYTSGALGWYPDDYGDDEQPYGEDGEPLMCLYFSLATEN